MSNGNGWKVVGCLCGLGGILALTSYASNAIKHCSDEKTERSRIELDRTKYMCDSEDRRAQMEYDISKMTLES